ncbi:LysR family transcriptional regulator [Herbaspirillum rhizosphaerae]|uniref:LysR family transcriptional regulator n=1 Tax=Herbaspirillum rhizosphaerae TaxID=346179 RepID=UPI00067DB801|nr:LysR family transcriptional regulator [Herbaspirillum rhizosphaerae]
MNDRILSLRLFTRVARTGSFSRAGRELGLTQSSVSRIVAALEGELGVALLTRTTRAVTLSEAGTDYLARIEPILAALEEADQAARGTGELHGILRIGVSSSFAVRELAPRLPAFMNAHPALRVELLMNDQRQELVAEGVDVALRFGKLADSTATARRLGAIGCLLVASPAYLKKHGMPDSPAAIADHSVIVGPVGSGRSWTFQKDGRVTSIRIDGRLLISTNEAAIAAATAGLGIASTSLWGCRAELAAGALVQVLPEWEIAPVELHAVFAAGRAVKLSARMFGDWLAESLADGGESAQTIAA